MPIYDLICICMHLMFLFLQKNGDASSKVWFFHSHVSFRGCIWSKRTAGIIQHGSEPPLRIPTPSLACSQDSSQWRGALGKGPFRSIVDVYIMLVFEFILLLMEQFHLEWMVVRGFLQSTVGILKEVTSRYAAMLTCRLYSRPLQKIPWTIDVCLISLGPWLRLWHVLP